MPRFDGWHAIKRGIMEEEKVPLQRSLPYLKKCIPFIMPYLKYIIFGTVCLVLQTGAGLLIPVITMLIIDDVIPLGTEGFSLLNLLILGWFLLALAQNVIGVLQAYLFTFANQSIFHDLRTKMFNHIQKFPITYFEKQQTGNIMSRIINDVGALSGVFGTTFTNFSIDVLQIIGIAIFMFWLHPTLAVISLIVAPFFAISFLLFKDKMKSIQKLTQEKWALMSGALQERLSGIRVVKAFVREEHEGEVFRERSDKVGEYQIRANLLRSLGGMITGIIGVLGPVLITWYGVMEIVNGNLTLGQYFAFSQWTMRLLGPARQLVMLMFGIQFSLGAAERVFEVLEEPTEDDGKQGLEELPDDFQGDIEFKDVVFGYDDNEDVLKGINLHVPASNVVALVGLSGAGKSTLAKLLLRFYPLRAGKILIDGMDISQVKLGSLRDKIGFIDQDTFLFDTTVKENILYGKPQATEDEIIEAAKAANAHEFITELPEGYNTLIGERGVKLSGGQKQRISVARTFLKDPKILMLDEATSSLDSQSESAIHDALDKLMKGRTTIIISHRLATLQKADKICVLKDGMIEQEGTHLELIAQGGLYKYLFELQYLKTGTEDTPVHGEFKGEAVDADSKGGKNAQFKPTGLGGDNIGRESTKSLESIGQTEDMDDEKEKQISQFMKRAEEHPRLKQFIDHNPDFVDYLRENPDALREIVIDPQNGRKVVMEYMQNKRRF